MKAAPSGVCLTWDLFGEALCLVEAVYKVCIVCCICSLFCSVLLLRAVLEAEFFLWCSAMV